MEKKGTSDDRDDEGKKHEREAGTVTRKQQDKKQMGRGKNMGREKNYNQLLKKELKVNTFSFSQPPNSKEKRRLISHSNAKREERKNKKANTEKESREKRRRKSTHKEEDDSLRMHEAIISLAHLAPSSVHGG